VLSSASWLGLSPLDLDRLGVNQSDPPHEVHGADEPEEARGDPVHLEVIEVIVSSGVLADVNPALSAS
jgi:hypothetical protein